MVLTFLTWTPQMTTDMIGYIEDIITDLTPLLVPIIAIGLGLIIFAVILKAVRGD